MTNRFLTLLFSVLLLSVTVFAGVIKDGSLRGSSDSNGITIQWVSEDETGLTKFGIERKAGVNGSFMLLAELQPKGNNSSYSYLDEVAFRVTSESIYKYQIRATFSNGSTALYGPVTVSNNHTSDVRRTWGMIKAMFK